MRSLNKLFENRTINYAELIKYGFIKKNDNYVFKKTIDNQFEVIIEIGAFNSSRLIDLTTNEEYILVDVKESLGSYAASLKNEYEKIIEDIINKCTTRNTFKSKQAKLIIKYIKEKYDDDLEFLWEKFPNVAIWRNKKNQKWYGALMTITKSKLKLDSNELVDIIDLRCNQINIKEKVNIYPGYHMNKNNWITIILDESISIEEIYNLIDISNSLSSKK